MVTEALAKLHNKGAMKYFYSKVEVLDRAQVEKVSCSCFAYVQGAVDEYLKESMR